MTPLHYNKEEWPKKNIDTEQNNNEEMENNKYDKFIRRGLACSFTDDQIDFLWDWINEIARDKARSGGFF